MRRQVKPEWLDLLPPNDTAAKRSRRDLRRVNTWMGNPRILARALQSAAGVRPLRTLVDLGAGDGHFLLRVTQRVRPLPTNARALLLDRFSLVDSETEALKEQTESLREETISLRAELKARDADVAELRRQVAELMKLVKTEHDMPLTKAASR